MEDIVSMKLIVRQLANDLKTTIDLKLVLKDLDLADKLDSVDDRYSQAWITCGDKSLFHPNWALLAGRIQMHKIKTIVPATFSQATEDLKSILYEPYYFYVMKYAERLDKMIDHERDWKYNLSAVSVFEKSYLAKIKKDDDEIVIKETPQYLYMRVATFLWMNSSENEEEALSIIEKKYNEMSMGYYTHASPTLFNSGMKRHQCSSCFLMDVGDNIESISKSWRDAAFISRSHGGVGIDISSLRHSEIGITGKSRGIVPWIKIYNEIMTTINQGGKRNGSATIYCTDWHIDVYEFIEMKKNVEPDSMRARDLYYALMISDEFMRRVRDDADWVLFCPNKTCGLEKTWGIEFEMKYRLLEKKAKEDSEQRIIHGRKKSNYYRVIKARDLWMLIITTQIELGMPFILYKDSINRKNNQSNIGMIRLSNLCLEIVEYTDKNNIASCNLASIALDNFVDVENETYDFNGLEEVTISVVRNLNQVIDRNYYIEAVPEIKNSNMTSRPLGIGVQGLADTFALLDYEWADPRARQLNIEIFETIYYAALKESMIMAKETGPYDFFQGSPLSKGLFQFDLWTREGVLRDYLDQESPEILELSFPISKERVFKRYDWDGLEKKIVKHGVKNSLLIALMPTATSSILLERNECIEPFTTQIQLRNLLSGQFVFTNKYLVQDMDELGLWNAETIQNLIENHGSVQNLNPQNISLETKCRLNFLKRKYKTVYEIPQKLLVEMALDRGRYVDQSQSFNCWMSDPTYKKVNAYHFCCWKGGLKTGMYYLRQQAGSYAINVSKDSIKVKNDENVSECTGDVCMTCQS